MFEWVEIANIPHLLVLNSRLRQGLTDDPEKQRIQEFFLEQLPYSMSAAAMALVNLAKSQIDAPTCSIYCDELVSLQKSVLTNHVGTLPFKKTQELNKALCIALDIPEII